MVTNVPGLDPGPCLETQGEAPWGCVDSRGQERPAGTTAGPGQVGSCDRWCWGVRLVRWEELQAPECVKQEPVTLRMSSDTDQTDTSEPAGCLA